MARLAATADPSKTGGKKDRAPIAESSTASEQPPALTPVSNAYRDAVTLKEQSNAQLLQLKVLQETNQVSRTDDMVRAMLDTHTAARTEVLGLADRLTQLVVAETDARKVYDTITRECERICDRMTRRIDTLRQQHSTTTVTA